MFLKKIHAQVSFSKSNLKTIFKPEMYFFLLNNLKMAIACLYFFLVNYKKKKASYNKQLCKRHPTCFNRKMVPVLSFYFWVFRPHSPIAAAILYIILKISINNIHNILETYMICTLYIQFNHKKWKQNYITSMRLLNLPLSCLFATRIIECLECRIV